MKSLDLHSYNHEEAEDAVMTFLNWTDVPCKVITGNSKKMKIIVKSVVHYYGLHCYEESSFNSGALIIVEGGEWLN